MDIRKQVREHDLRRQLDVATIFTGWAELMMWGRTPEGPKVPYSCDSLTLRS